VSARSRIHFGRPAHHHLRFAYSGIDTLLIEEGLDRLKVHLES
jgi:hypothetical protein